MDRRECWNSYLDYDFPFRTRLEAILGDTVELKCSFHNVHHEIDMDIFSIEWIKSGYNSKASPDFGASSNNGEFEKEEMI